MVMDLTELRGHEDNLSARLATVRSELAQKNAQTRELPALREGIAAIRNATPYRTADLASLETKLAEAHAARADRARLRIEEAGLLKDAESIRVQLEQNGIRKVTLPILEDVKIAAPCDASWADMEGDTDVRFCKSCEKSVYNLSMMSREEAEAVLRAGSGRDICVRLYRRVDGTVLTEDCPVGLGRQRFWRRARGIAAAGLIAAALGIAYKNYIENEITKSNDVVTTMGLEPR